MTCAIGAKFDLNYCEAKGKGRAKGRLRKVTQRTFIIIYALFEFHYMNSMFNKNELTLFATEDSNPGASEVHVLS